MMSGSSPTRILSASLWSILSEVTAGGVRVLSYFIYARLLSPADFGLVGFCILIISLFPLLIDNSLALALMRADKDDQHTFSIIFIINVVLSIIAIAALCVSAGWAANFVHDRRVTLLLPILSVQLLCNSLCATHIAIARRHFEYRRLMPVRLIAILSSLAVGLPLAYLGYAYWSLVLGSILTALSQMIAAWVLLPWRPSLQFDWRKACSVLSFASWTAVDMGVTWMVISGGGFFLAFFLGTRDLGLYRLSDQIDAYLLGAVLSPLIPVLYRAFCEVASDREKWRQLFARSAHTVAVVAMMLAGIAVVLARPLETMAGEKWQGVGDIIAINAIADGFSYATLTIPSLMRAQGHARTVAMMRIVMVVGQVLVYSLVAPLGLRAFVVGKLILEIAVYLFSYAVLRVKFTMPVLGMIGTQIVPALVAAVAAAAGIGITRCSEPLGATVALTFGFLAFCILVGGYLLLFERRSMARLLAVLTRRQTGPI